MVVALLLAACGSGGGDDEPATAPGAGDLEAQVASYDLAAGGPQRFSVGILTPDRRLVAYGEASLAFAFAGTREAPVEDPEPAGPARAASFRPVPGGEAPPPGAEPRVVEPTDAVGVYGTDVSFDRPGIWQVTATVALDGEERTATAPFEVLDRHRVVAPGDPAPASANLLPGAPGAPPQAVDSRATEGAPVPDPELHATTVADALAAGRPAMVVVSTPVYCVSQFCGPITDAVAAVARRHGDAMAFVHLEVWRDFEVKEVNKAAAEWIYRPGAVDLNEPWVFVVGRDGRVAERFDNVVTDAELEAAATAVLG